MNAMSCQQAWTELTKKPASGPALDLVDRADLCVGGRTQGIPVYRQVIENRGARFLHHDGGEQDKASRSALERALGQLAAGAPVSAA